MTKGNATVNHTEAETLRHFLDAQRESVLAIVGDLGDELGNTPVLPSGWTPFGMVLHLGGAEQHWFQEVFTGAASEHAWPDGIDEAYDPDAPFTTRHSAEVVFAFYRRQCEISNEILASSPLEATPMGRHNQEWPGEEIDSLRWIALHLIEETARHAGHLDAARELLDGTIGRGPR